MPHLFTRSYWDDAGERTVRTFAQSSLAALTLAPFALMLLRYNAGLFALAFGGLAAVYGLITSLAAVDIGKRGSASFRKED